VDVNSYLTFLLFGVLVIVIDGQLIYRGGTAYLARAYPDPSTARSVNRLVAVLFHLIVLGLFAFVSTIAPRTGNAAEDVVIKLGVVLLLVALAHGATMLILSRIKHRQREEDLAEEITEQVEERLHGEQTRRETHDRLTNRDGDPPPSATVEVRTPNDSAD
jgi:hypothetical protein